MRVDNTRRLTRSGLPPGIHDIFVYVDPNLGETDSSGTVIENEEDDNIAYRQISIDMGVIGGTSSNQIASLDGNCIVTAPPGVLQNPTVFRVATLSAHSADNNVFNGVLTTDSNSVKRAPLPSGADGYQLAISNQQSDAASELPTAFSLTSPIAIDCRFDLGVLSAQLAQELLGSSEEVTDISDITTTIGAAVAARAREIGVYQWNTTLGNWIRLPSQLLTDATGTLQQRIHATDIGAENVGEGELRDVRIHADGAPTGKYVLLFTGPQTYRLLHAPFIEETRLLEALEVVAPREQLTGFSTDYPNFRHGFSVNVETDPEQPFKFGDVWTFNITALEQSPDTGADFDTASQQELRWYASGFGDVNRGSGILSYIELAPDTEMPEDRWVIFFLTDTAFQIEGEKTGILRSQTGGNTPLRGTVGQPFFYAPYGLRFQITQGRRAFTPGDRFRFETRAVGTIRGTTDQLGTVTLLHTDDTVPPNIQLTIGNQQHFVPGDATDAEPLIGATLTDPSGIDYLTRSLLLELGSGLSYEPINPEAYQLAYHPGSNQLVLTYLSPELEPREYEIRLTASDAHGNTNTERITFRVHDTLQLLSFLNYPNPFPRKTTLTCELTAPADSLVVKIYTLSGRLIRELSMPATPGFLMVEWDGRDADGIEVANGVYYAKLQIKQEGEKDITEILKMMKLR